MSILKVAILAVAAFFVGCGGSSDGTSNNLAIGPVNMPDTLRVNEPAEFFIAATNIGGGNRVTMTDCQNLQVLEEGQTGIKFSCTPSSIGSKMIVLTNLKGEQMYQQQALVFCPTQTIEIDGVCFVPQASVVCPLGYQETGGKTCVEKPLEGVEITPKIITELTKTKMTVTAKALPTDAVLLIDGAVCDHPIEMSSTKLSQMCIFSTVGLVQATVKYALDVSAGKVTLPLTVTSKSVSYQAINDTGMSQCTDNMAFFSDCGTLLSGWLGLSQDAEVGRDDLAKNGQLTKLGGGNAGFDFSKISASGEKLPANATEWNCVLDNVTGLMWENKTKENQFDTYALYDSNNTSNNGSIGNWNNGKNSQLYVLDMNQKTWCGYSDWRMPSASELLSIVDFGVKDIAIDSQYFSYTQPNWYISATPSLQHANWQVNFDSTATGSGKTIVSLGHVRLVR